MPGPQARPIHAARQPGPEGSEGQDMELTTEDRQRVLTALQQQHSNLMDRAARHPSKEAQNAYLEEARAFDALHKKLLAQVTP